MGADAFADKNGELEIEVRRYSNSEVLHRFKYCGLDPEEPLTVEFVKGEPR